jgi:hypothetical protein
MRHALRLAAALTLIGTPAFAQDSVEHASAAVNASGEAVAHLATAGIQAVGGVVATPIGLAGGVSEVVGGVARTGGESLEAVGVDAQRSADRAITDSWGPLSVDNRIIVRPDPAPRVPYEPRKAAGR